MNRCLLPAAFAIGAWATAAAACMYPHVNVMAGYPTVIEAGTGVTVGAGQNLRSECTGLMADAAIGVGAVKGTLGFRTISHTDWSVILQAGGVIYRDISEGSHLDLDCRGVEGSFGTALMQLRVGALSCSGRQPVLGVVQFGFWY